MMKLHLLPVFAVLLLAVTVQSNATLPSELYWEKILQNTPMPKALRDLLQPSDLKEEKTHYVSVDTGKPGHVGTNVNFRGKDVEVNNPGQTSVAVANGVVGVSTDHKGKPVNVYVSPFLYTYSATEDRLDDNPHVGLFFLEKYLKPNAKMNLQLTRTSAMSTFLPREVSEAIPFSSQSLHKILNKLSVEPSSEEAQAMKNTIKECEEPAMVGEDKYCATSLESMIDFSTSKLGTNVKVMATESENSKKQEYTVKGMTQELSRADDVSVVCHRQSYVYAVFNCHVTRGTKAYEVPLVGADGSKAKAVAVCHTDTASWNHKHLAFRVLKVKPGTVPICHFLPTDHIIWVRNQKSTKKIFRDVTSSLFM